MPLTEILAPTDISNTGEVVFQPRITALSNGDYALTYVNLDLPDKVISAVFDAQGQPVGSSAVVQFVDEESDIAGLSGGGYALAWDDLLTGGIFTAVYNAQGQQISTPVNAINSPDPNSPGILPEVNALSNGGYALTWQVSTTFGNYDIITTIFDAQGQQVVAPINVASTPDINDGGAAVAALSAGGYALAWTAGTLNGTEIFAAVYDNQGQQVAAPVIVAAGSDAQVAALSTGGYALFWDSGDVFTAVYDPQGQQVSAPVKVSNSGGVSAFVQMTALSNGAYALTWDAGDVFTAVYDSRRRRRLHGGL